MNKMLVLIAVLFLIACLRPLESQRAAGCNESPDVACTEQGAIRGVVEGEMLAFKGIPMPNRLLAHYAGVQPSRLSHGKVCATATNTARCARRLSPKRLEVKILETDFDNLFVVTPKPRVHQRSCGFAISRYSI